ncbi:MAG: TerC family protein [Hymenobacteraceae bacterium]|nr:TerC family protein [Hymenobacteraceae bacterium]
MTWLYFNLLVFALLALDLFVLNRRDHIIGVREALGWSAFWIAVSLTFNYFVYWWRGEGPAVEFLTAYLLEKSLSVDNLFVFILLFNYFKVPPQYQHKVLFWGIIGALILRATFILVGVTLINKFAWTTYILGAFLVYTGIQLFRAGGEPEIHPEGNFIVRWVSRHLPVTREFEGGKFFVRKEKIRFATPLFIVLVMVETTDVVFAADSIPAVLAVSRDPFIVYSSNVFALLGLRALYFALAGVIHLFHYLHYGLALILVFIGCKMIAAYWGLHLDDVTSLMVVGGVLLVSMVASLLFPKASSD